MKRFIGEVLRNVIALLLLPMTLFCQATLADLVNPRWKLNVDSSQIEALWAYDTSCAHVTPLRNHDWRALSWFTAPVTDQDPQRSMLAYWKVDTTSTSEREDGDVWFVVTTTYRLSDTIVLDTSVVTAPGPVRHRIIAHEMLHQLIHDRHLPDSTPDYVHPSAIFIDRCHVQSGPSLTDSVSDILPVKP